MFRGVYHPDWKGILTTLILLRHTTAQCRVSGNFHPEVSRAQEVEHHHDLCRAHDQTVPYDYFAAMERVEQRLEIKPIQGPDSSIVNVQPIKKEPGQILLWLEHLALPELSWEEWLEIAQNLKHALCIGFASQLSLPMVYAG
jgi:hypothetical protein